MKNKKEDYFCHKSSYVDENVTIPSGQTAVSFGRIELNTSKTITVSSGAVWKIV